MSKINELGWIENKEFLQTMGFCKRTAQTWRDKNIIPFTQIGGKIYYKVSDIEQLLQGNIKIKPMTTSIIILGISLLTVLFICNTKFMRNLGDKFNTFVNKIIDKLNRF